MTLDDFEAVTNAATPGPWDTSDIGPTELNRPHKKYIRIPEHEDALFIAAARTMSPKMIKVLKICRDLIFCEDPVISPGVWINCDRCDGCKAMNAFEELEKP